MQRTTHRLEGREALRAVGMPPAFARQVMAVGKQLGGAFAFRAGAPFQLYDTRCAPKPGYIKIKSSNWGMMKGVLAVDPDYARMNSDGSLVKANMEDERKHWKEWSSWKEWKEAKEGDKLNAVVPVQHKVTLGQVMEGIKSGEYERVDPVPGVPEKDKGKYLCVRPKNAPKDSKAMFLLDMSAQREEALLKTPKQRKSILGIIKAKLAKPSWWKKEWGEYTSEMANERIPVYSKKNPGAEIKPLEVYGVPTAKENDVLPITGDMDLLWVARPTGQAIKESNGSIPQLPPEADVVLNTFKPSGRKAMLLNLLSITASLNLAEKQISDQMIGRMGIMTPRESLMTAWVNERFYKIAPHIRYLFQHGAENRSPFRGLVDINGPMVHIFEGRVVLTRDEKDLVDFVLNTKGYMEKNYFDIHPSWNMEVWAPVVKRQKELGQPIPDEVLDAYRAYQVKHHLEEDEKKESSSPPEFDRKESTRFEEESKDAIRIYNVDFDLRKWGLDKKYEECFQEYAKNMAQFAKQKGWRWNEEHKEIVIENKEKDDRIVIKLNDGFLSTEQENKEAVKIILEIAEAIKFPQNSRYLWGRTHDIKERLVDIAYPSETSSTYRPGGSVYD